MKLLRLNGKKMSLLANVASVILLATAAGCSDETPDQSVEHLQVQSEETAEQGTDVTSGKGIFALRPSTGLQLDSQGEQVYSCLRHDICVEFKESTSTRAAREDFCKYDIGAILTGRFLHAAAQPSVLPEMLVSLLV